MKKIIFSVILFAILILSASFFASWQISNAQTPITKEIILKILDLKVDSYTEKLIGDIKSLGVSFVLTDEIEKELVEKGASPQLIKIIRENAPKPSPTPISNETIRATPTPVPTVVETIRATPTPTVKLTGNELSKEDIIKVLTSKADTTQRLNLVLVDRINERKVSFEIDDETEKELKSYGASSALIQAIRSNGPASILKISGKVVKNSIGMELVSIPAGTFKMGTDSLKKITHRGKQMTNNDLQRGNEDPAHTVTIKQGFLMGKYEVTQEEWEKVMGVNIRKQRDKTLPNPEYNPKPEEGLYGEGARFPIYYVSWDDAKKFIKKLNEMDSQFTYSLPSEAQWEYACRAGTTGDYGGTGNIDDMGWYVNNSGKTYGNAFDVYEKIYEETNGEKTYSIFVDRFIKANKIDTSHEVGQKKANKFGLYDMHGNVWEWCEDYFADYAGLPTDGSANTEVVNKGERVIRGGSWSDPYPFEELSRSAYRGYFPPATRQLNFGLRVVAQLK